MILMVVASTTGIGVISVVTSIGLAPGSLHASLALIVLLGLLSIVRTGDWGPPALRDGLTAMVIPLFIVFLNVVFWNTLLALRLV